MPDLPLVGVVGVCSSGKSTLIRGLEERGYRCRHIAQEHSFAQQMWKIIAKPDVLIYLSCSFENANRRRKLNWTLADYEEQLRRLTHAREHADITLDSDALNESQVLAQALAALAKFS
ncbi:MAG: hypothetical protein LC099_06135 [Anaerolineales bacterium]|nr:hypothetical protein [Anaerolineales bacterium]